jgi:CO/xanthine dehydrogenase FAD-binding subunit
MQPFEYVRATGTDEAVALLARANGRARVLSGGTDLIVALREGRVQADLVVDIKFVPEVNQLTFDPATGLQIGAAVPCHRLYGSEPIAQAYPGLIDAASLIGGVQIQGRASLGGNLCNASPAADSIPALIAHGAVAHVAGPGGRRSLPVESFCTAPGRTVLQAGEFLVSLHLPPPANSFGAAYLRFIPRNEMDIAVVGAGVSVQLDESRTHFAGARIALAAVAPTPLFVADAGAALIGQAINQAAIDEAARVAQAAAQPISDMRGTAGYRRHLVGVLVRRALAKALVRAGAPL